MWAFLSILLAGLFGSGTPPLATTHPDSARVPAPARELPVVIPESAGMSADRLSRIDEVMARAITAGGFPGASVVVGRDGRVVWQRGYGSLDWGAGPRVDPARTLFDLASLTKVVATTSAVMLLVDRGRLSLDAPVARYLPEFGDGPPERREVTIRQLLTHRSGLPAGRNLAAAGGAPADARRAVLHAPLVNPPGSRVEYSDLGPDLLAFVVEQVSGEPFETFVRRHVLAPLGMRSTGFRPPPAVRKRVAPTSPGGAGGIVHDGNARALGGVAGHAGLFSTATDLALFAQMMLDGGEASDQRLASASTVAEFVRPGSGWRALGWETCPGGGSCGHRLAATAFGHTGFTGTSIWIDPESRIFVIVLTNAVLGGPGGRESPIAILHDARADVADLAALSIITDSGLAPMPTRMRSDLEIGWRP